MSFMLPALASAGIQTLGSIFGGRSQRRANEEAMRRQQEAYNRSMGFLQPWADAGGRALSAMENPDFNRNFTLADFMKDPGYDFRMGEGQRALEASQAARGGLMSGPAALDALKYGQNFASNEFGNAYNRWSTDTNNRFNRLNTIAGYGNSAMNSQVGLTSNLGQQQAQGAYNRGNINANMIAGITNALSGPFNMMAGSFMGGQMPRLSANAGNGGFGSYGGGNYTYNDPGAYSPGVW